ncbi:MAG: hypothetical protein ACP6IP_02390 [Candidatus Njordarchaeia archaeon]
MEYLSEIDRAIKVLKDLKEKIRKESIDWWWIDQGDSAFVSITKIEIRNKKIHMEETPKISIRIAVNMMIEQLEQIKKFYKEKKIQEAYTIILKTIEDDLYKIATQIKNIREAHKMVQQLEQLKIKIVNSEKPKEKINELENIIHGTIDWIREIITTQPQEWEKKKKTFNKVVQKLRREI